MSQAAEEGEVSGQDARSVPPDCAQGPARNGQQGVDLPLLLLLPLRLHRALQSEL